MPAEMRPVARRLRSYWRLEAGNVLFVPMCAGLLAWSADGVLTPAFWLAALACAALLAIGAVYWRAVYRRMQGAPGLFDTAIPWLAKAEPWSGLLVLAALAAVAAELWLEPTWPPGRIAAAALAALAVLEFVNYYRIQLQHFDNAADMRRLLTGRGFRKAHLARDIAAWRATAR